jgi:hypothetical protein
MLSFDKLMSLSEAATGFNGGSIVDELPGLSLTEATGRLPVVIMESQIELSECVQAQNEALVESVVSSLQNGTSVEVESLTEGAFETIKNKIKAFFDKIKKWIKGIIAKLTVQIDKVRMTGKQMKAKYKGSKMLNHSFEDLTVNGYKFEKKDPFTALDGFVSNPMSLISKGVPEVDLPGAFASKAKAADADTAALEATLEKIKDSTSNDRKLEFAKALTNGIDISGGDSWVADVKKELYGDKVDLKFGEDFTLASVEADLEGGNLDAIRGSYNKLLTAVNKNETELQKAADTFKKDNVSKTPGEDAPKAISLANSYFTAFLSIYQDCTAVITTVQDIQVNYEKQKVNQAKAIYARMLTYKKKDEKNEDASDITDIALMDFDM